MRVITNILIPIFLACFLFIGCAANRNRTLTDYYQHTVASQGETIAQISKWYTGRTNNWQEVMKHNPSLDAKKMRLGTVVQIPRNMLIREKPMPKFLPTTKLQNSSQSSPLEEEEELTEINSIPENTADDVEIEIAGSEAAANEQENKDSQAEKPVNFDDFAKP